MNGSFTWPTLPLPATLGAAGAILMALLMLTASHFLDRTGGLLTLSLLVVSAFVSVTFVSLLYPIEQTAIMEILVGALATSVGAIIAFWMSQRGPPTA